MNRLFVDTSGWANLFIPTETHHHQTRQLFLALYRDRQPIITSSYIIAELVSLLDTRLRAARSQKLEHIATLKNSPNITIIHITEEIDAAAWTLCQSRSDKPWSLVDCSSFVLMKQLNIQTALTTDRHFEQAGFIRLLKS